MASGLFTSKSEARRAIAQGGMSVNGTRIASATTPLPEPVAGRYLVLRPGRKRLVRACAGETTLRRVTDVLRSPSRPLQCEGFATDS